ncbi:Farnesoate epoxidase [Orchesella cincta]|uniref:Farnesoate epoxidase n=2 Tax=Orchesella cincta TaxID=48709 RepID=A0A1D2MTX8_ORCCI|nr:Farnesoate epoxidase [Orchesella cincta]
MLSFSFAMLGLTEYLLLAVAAIYLAIQFLKPKVKLPPGPRGLPVVGNILQMTEKPHLQLAAWAKQYGEIYTIQLGSNTGIVLNDQKLIKDVLSNTDFSFRPDIPLFSMFSGGEYGIINTNGAAWEEQRRWVLRKLRDYGFGKTSMEGVILDEVSEVVEYFKANGKTPIEVADRFNVATMNSIWTILNGKRLSQDDPKIRAVLTAFHDVPAAIGNSGLMFAPWLRHVYPKSYQVVKNAADSVMKYARAAVSEHFDSYQDGITRDFIDEYIDEIKKTEEPSSSFHTNEGRKNLEAVVSDLIQAGAETSSNTITWAIAYLSHNTKVQVELQKELDTVLGTRPVALSDKPDLPYTEAVILETLRHSSIVSGGVQHSEVNGYTIPKGAWIFTNIYFVHHNSKIWGDPENFRPDRFLSNDGKKLVKALIPFQSGRRQCLGESLARDTLFFIYKYHLSKI